VPDVNINVHHITRLEGHGNIVVNTKNGEIEELRLEIVESPRFFEAMLRGRKWNEATHLTCRICGICSCGHTTASLNALENWAGIEPSSQTKKLRKLLFNGEQIQSHVLHVLYLAAPDFLGVGSVIPLVETHREVVLIALRLKRLGNDICCLVGGRHVHPIAAAVNGFTKLPKMADLVALRPRLEAARADLAAVVGVLQTLTLPQFERETEYVALNQTEGNGEYPWQWGDSILSSEAGVIPLEEYRSVTNEYLVDHSVAKHAKHKRDSYMVGALARVNLHYDKLHPAAKQVAEALGLSVPNHNPFMINLAQVVETVHAVEHSLRMIDELEAAGLREEDRSVPVKAGTGIGAADVPRGILFHEYSLDENGTLTGSNLIIPTGQNLANIENDMRALVPQILDRPQEEVRHLCEMLVRAYDPCISCATHVLDVEFV
jgi:coenzyme F420-reducing hydrogenase alpha subunit